MNADIHLLRRDRRLLHGIAFGMTTKEMAAKRWFDIPYTPNTVESHRVRLFNKIGCLNAPHAVYIAMKNKWI